MQVNGRRTNRAGMREMVGMIRSVGTATTKMVPQGNIEGETKWQIVRSSG
jgi:hypothetical protein